jgi:hypothetical protein
LYEKLFLLFKKYLNFQVDITEMYPEIAWELVMDPLGFTEHTLGTTLLKQYCVWIDQSNSSPHHEVAHETCEAITNFKVMLMLL